MTAHTTPAVLMSSRTITSAQLLALDVTPIQLLPALSGRNYYVIHNQVLHYRFVTSAYNENVRFNLKVGFGTTIASISSGNGQYVTPLANTGTPFDNGDLFKQTADAYVFLNSIFSQVASQYGWLAVDIETKPLLIGLSGATLTGGQGTLTVRTFYTTIDGA